MADYTPPGIRVEQVRRTTPPTPAEPTQMAAIVGPVYQVEKKEKAGEYTGMATSTLTYPKVKAGAVIDHGTDAEFPPTIYLVKDGEEYEVSAETTTASVGDLDGTATTLELPAGLEYIVAKEKSDGAPSGDGSFSSSTSTFITSGVRIGDWIKIGSVLTEIEAVVSETQVLVEGNGPAATTNQPFEVVRLLGRGAPYNETSEVLVSYRAARSDAAVVGTYLEAETTDDLRELFGENGFGSEENPLGYAMALALSAGGVKVAGVGINAKATSSVEYQAAAEALAPRPVHFTVALTMESGDQDVLIAAAKNRSRPAQKGERVIYISREYVGNRLLVASGTGATITATTFTKAGAGFGDGTGLVRIGDIIVVGNNEYTVSGVTTTMLTIASGTADTGAYNIYRPQSKSQQASQTAAIARGLGRAQDSHRVILCGPDKVKIPLNGEDQELDGMYWAAIKAGMRAGANPGQPLLNANIPFLTGVVKGSEYFTPDQLNIIAGGGWQLAVQDNDGAPCYIRDELTTSQSRDARFTQEAAVTAVDYAAVVFRNTLRSQVGTYNLTNRMLGLLRTTATAIATDLLTLPDTPFEVIEILSVERSESDQGKAVLEMRIEQNTPYTGATVRLLID